MGLKKVVYCDESRHTLGEKGGYWSIGSLWLPREKKREFTKKIRTTLDKFCLRGEVKWSKVSRVSYEGYCALVDLFMEEEYLKFRTIVVDYSTYSAEIYHGGDNELGFYKLYYELLIKWIEDNDECLFLLDYQTVKNAERYKELKMYLQTKIGGRAIVSDLTVVNSQETPIVQMADLFTGAVAAAWCGVNEGTPKEQLIKYIESKIGRSLRAPSLSPNICKFNIFKILFTGKA